MHIPFSIAGSKMRARPIRSLKIIVADSASLRHRARRGFIPADPAGHRCRAVQRHAAHLSWDDFDRLDYIDAHTEGFADLKRTVRDYTPKFVADISVSAEQDLMQAGALVRRFESNAVAVLPGFESIVLRHGKKMPRWINLHLATHQIGKRARVLFH